jgi:hypothetical protein
MDPEFEPLLNGALNAAFTLDKVLFVLPSDAFI